jgi:ribonucleoside-diphosphate reductase alpha chain
MVEKKKSGVAVTASARGHKNPAIPAPSDRKTGTWSETATRVLRERYLLRDETGAIVETPDDLCWRVATSVAAAEEQWTKDRAAVAETAQRFYDMMVEHRFLPNSPTLMNAGKGNNLQLSACFPAGAMIATREGPAPIEDIQPGDAVLTDRGRYRPVVETMTRRDVVYRIKVDKLPTFEVTGEHPFFTQRGWVKAAELEPCADFVFVGTYTERHDAVMGLPRISVRGVRVGEHVYHPISVTSSRYGRGEEVSQQIRAVTADVEIDEEIAWLLGYYIAEGSISAGYDLRFTANVDERALLERVLDILQRRLNLTGSIYATARTTTHGEWLSARVHSKLFTEWLDIHFSHGFARKKLPAWLFDAPTSVISSFLQGVADGDGTPMNATQVRITLSNEALVRQLFELLRIMGHAPSLSREYRPDHATTQAWSVTYGLHVNRGMVHDREDGAVAYRVRSVGQVGDTPVDVYNLEVAEDHTYVANQIVVHNCYVVPVEDSLEGIFEAVKHAALIHQSGGGCISGDAHVFTTFCGVEAIETLYARVQETGYAEERRGDHAVIDVRDLNIRTMALNPADGGYEPAQVTHLWRYNVPLDDQVRVRAANGLEVTTSCWHPFMVFDGQQLVERRADSLRAGDILPTSNGTVRERWPHSAYREVAGVLLDEEIAWLLGYYLGDGNLGWAKVPSSEPRRAKLRWRLFDGRTASLEYARDILARRFSVHINIQCDARGLYCLATTDSGFIQRFRDLIEIYPGPKGELPFPEIVAKSPLSVVGAFLAGLVDSDGYVEANRDRVTVTTQSHHLASKVHTLASLLGLAPGLRSRAPQGKGKVTMYEVKLAAEPMIADLRDLIGPYINDTLKSERLAETARNHDHSTETRLSLPFSAVEDVLKSVGVVTTTTEIHRQPVHIGETEIWLHRWKEGLGVNSQKLLTVIAALRPLVANSFQSRLDVLERLARGATTVTAIERPETSVPFYDFTVADHSTYLAGVNGLTAIHNTGFSFSRLRQKGSIVGSTHGVASGPVSFMKIFDGATEAVKQGGTRRGANMGVLRIDHPDVEEFIDCKRDGSVTNFNISVGVTDTFMQALENDAEYELVNPHDGTIAGVRRARAIMDKIVDAAWATGDPGLLFLDRANRSTANPIPEIERLEATNPCGEQWLGPYDACNLGSINVGLFVARDERGKATAADWAAIEEATRLCVRFLDDVIEINPYPLEEVREKVTANRRIGLGVMGWAELLFELGLRYDSDEAIALGERLMTSIRDWARSASEDLAAERSAFPNWSHSIYKHDKPARNSTRTTVAPTGSISILAECSSGIEPIFALAFQHRVKQPDGGYRVLDFVNPFFERALLASDIVDKDDVLDYVKEHGSLHGHDAEEHPALRPFVTAHEIAPDWHIRMQAAFQRGVENSISKTVNLNHEATREDVRQAYMLAWDLNCLGITIFRDGSKGEQVLNVGVKDEKKDEQAIVTRAAPTASPRYRGGIKDRPEVVHGYTRQVRAPEGKVNITLNSDEDGLLEIFVNVGKAGSDIAALAEAVGRLASLNLRLDSPLSQNERAQEIARQLKSIGGSASVGFGMERVRSLPDAVARSIDRHFAGGLGEQGGVSSDASEQANGGAGHANGGGAGAQGLGLNPMMMAHYAVSGNLCSHCGNNTMVYEEGCKKCASCGHSEC